jgi:hypothetical protein
MLKPEVLTNHPYRVLLDAMAESWSRACAIRNAYQRLQALKDHNEIYAEAVAVWCDEEAR